MNQAAKTIQVISGSNIAFVKYWGKKDPVKQIPANASISMTLANARSTTTVRSSEQDEIILSGQRLNAKSTESAKTFGYLQFVKEQFATSGCVRVESNNSFPAACGIASSASGYSAMGLALAGYFCNSTNFDHLVEQVSWERLCQMIRLGSGSACRSLLGGFVQWQEDGRVEPIASANHWDLSDLIVLVSSEPKKYSSSEGHLAAGSSPLYRLRTLDLARRNREVIRSIQTKDLQRLGPILEQEACEMHAIMLTSSPKLKYFSDATLRVLQFVRKIREAENLQVYFTLDAGPNVHLICQANQAALVAEKVADQFSQFEILMDKVGGKPKIDWKEPS